MIHKIEIIWIFYKGIIIPSLLLSIGLPLIITNGSQFDESIGISFMFFPSLFHFFVYEIGNSTKYYFFYNLGFSRMFFWRFTIGSSLIIGVILIVITLLIK